SLSRMSSKDTSGTILYMAPEQLRGKGVDGRSDVYSVGATMYELLSGRPPFHSGGLEYQILHEPPEPVAGLPERINEILWKALARDKEQRWPSARALLEALEGRIEVDRDRQKRAAEGRWQPEERGRVEEAPRLEALRLEEERRLEEPRVKEEARR